MATLNRLRVTWTGSPVVGPGLTTFYFTSPDMSGIPDAVASFFDDANGFYPSGITWTIPDSGDQLESTTGALVGSWTATGGTTINSSSTAGWVLGVGARVVWETGGIVNGRRIRGSTFLVPLAKDRFDTDGTLTTAAISGLDSVAGALFTAADGHLVIWSRPRGGGDSGVSPVTNVRVPDQVSWLRSRRT